MLLGLISSTTQTFYLRIESVCLSLLGLGYSCSLPHGESQGYNELGKSVDEEQMPSEEFGRRW